MNLQGWQSGCAERPGDSVQALCQTLAERLVDRVTIQRSRSRPAPARLFLLRRGSARQKVDESALARSSPGWHLTQAPSVALLVVVYRLSRPSNRPAKASAQCRAYGISVSCSVVPLLCLLFL